MIDHIGGKHISLRRSTTGGIAIRQLSGNQSLELSADEWIELVILVMAVKAAVDFADGYEPKSG